MSFVPSPIQREVLDKGAMPLKSSAFPFHFSLKIHNIPCRFHFSSEALLEKLKKFFPLTWQQSFLEEEVIEIYWESPQSILKRDLPNWGELRSSDCHFLDNWVLQRDFIAQSCDPKKYFLVAEQQVDDGLFNFLRYLLPRELLQKNSVLFHSSCVVDERNGAYLFFGPSGAGKTTLSQLCQGGNVLGDDMNLLKIENKKVLVEPALVGQRYYSPKNFAKTFEIKAAFWLTQFGRIEISSLQEGSLNKLLSSFVGLFWDQLSTEDYQKVFNLAHTFSKKLRLMELKFNPTQEVWDHVRNFGQNL